MYTHIHTRTQSGASGIRYIHKYLQTYVICMHEYMCVYTPRIHTHILHIHTHSGASGILFEQC